MNLVRYFGVPSDPNIMPPFWSCPCRMETTQTMRTLPAGVLGCVDVEVRMGSRRRVRR